MYSQINTSIITETVFEKKILHIFHIYFILRGYGNKISIIERLYSFNCLIKARNSSIFVIFSPQLQDMDIINTMDYNENIFLSISSIFS